MGNLDFGVRNELAPLQPAPLMTATLMTYQLMTPRLKADCWLRIWPPRSKTRCPART